MAYNDSLSNIEWIEVGREPSETSNQTSTEKVETETRYQADAFGKVYTQTRSRTVTVNGDSTAVYVDVSYEARSLTAALAQSLVASVWQTAANVVDCRAARATDNGYFTVTKVLREGTLRASGTSTKTYGEWSEWAPAIPTPPAWSQDSVSPQSITETEETNGTEYESQWIEYVSKYAILDGSYVPIHYKTLRQVRWRTWTKTKTQTNVYNEITSSISGLDYATALRVQREAYKEDGIVSASISSQTGKSGTTYTVTKVVKDPNPLSEGTPTEETDYGEWSEWAPEPPEPPEPPGGSNS